jgi:hypothetical protein
MIQELYQTLKKTQPQLFTKSSQIDKTSIENLNNQQSTTDNNPNEDIEEDEEIEVEEEEEIIPLTPEMEHANTIYNQAMKLINVTNNRQYDT